MSSLLPSAWQSLKGKGRCFQVTLGSDWFRDESPEGGGRLRPMQDLHEIVRAGQLDQAVEWRADDQQYVFLDRADRVTYAALRSGDPSQHPAPCINDALFGAAGPPRSPARATGSEPESDAGPGRARAQDCWTETRTRTRRRTGSGTPLSWYHACGRARAPRTSWSSRLCGSTLALAGTGPGRRRQRPAPEPGPPAPVRTARHSCWRRHGSTRSLCGAAGVVSLGGGSTCHAPQTVRAPDRGPRAAGHRSRWGGHVSSIPPY
jgi:hypothetical protein